MLAAVIHSDAETMTSSWLSQLSVKVGTHIKILDLRNIVCVRAAGNYVDLTMSNGKTLHTKETMSHIASRLPERSFIRIHRSYVVNREHVREMQSHQSNYEFTLSNGTRLLSSVTYRRRVRGQFLIGLKGGSRSTGTSLESDIAEPFSRVLPHQFERPADVKTRTRAGIQGDEYALVFLGKITFVETYVGVFANEDILLHSASHDDPALYRAWLEDKAAGIWILETETGNTPVGYLVLTPPTMPFAGVRHNRDLEIQRIYLLKSFQKMGLGRYLMTQALRYAQHSGYRRLVLKEYPENKPMIAFCQRLGFRPIGECLCRIGNHDYNDIVFGLEL